MVNESRIAGNKQEFTLNLLFAASCTMVLFTRLVIFFRYNLDIIDTDQPYMWQGASDYAQGFFYEPRYYGQSYNTFMEGLFAVPLLWLKVPVYYAVPLATHFISLFPFVFTAGYLFAKHYKIQAILVMAVLLCLPAGYDLLNSLPRGFVTGLFFCSFFIVSILNPGNMGLIAFNTVMAAAGYFVNPNSVLVSLPFLFYLFLQHYKSRRFYVFVVPAALSVIPFYCIFDHFYSAHPEYVVHPFDNQVTLNVFRDNISDLDTKLAHVSFFFQKNATALFIVLAAIAVAFYFQNKKALAAFAVFVGVCLFSFCVVKTMEGSKWIFASLSRMYLGIPLLICLFISMLNIQIKKTAILLLALPLVFSVYKLAYTEEDLKWHLEDHGGVRLLKLKASLEAIDFYKKPCIERKINFLLISSHFWLSSLISAGGPAVYSNFPETQETSFEKRYWVREKNKNRVIERFVFLSSDSNLEKSLPPPEPNFELERIDNCGLYLVKNNKLTMGRFIAFVNSYETF